MSKEIDFKDVVDRLDELITLFKLANYDKIKKGKNEIMKDPVSRKIIELADGTREYNVLAEEVAKITGKSERTVKSRISELSDKGAIKGKRAGKKVYYETIDLFK